MSQLDSPAIKGNVLVNTRAVVTLVTRKWVEVHRMRVKQVIRFLVGANGD